MIKRRIVLFGGSKPPPYIHLQFATKYVYETAPL